MLEFDEKYLYGIPEMDDEHKELIEKAENLINAYQNNNPEEEILKLMFFLKEYVDSHFSSEEALQKKYNYPEFEHHKALHNEFKLKFLDLYEEVLTKGLDLSNRLQFNHLCSEWILKHIGEEDKKIAEHILKVKGQSS